jgi:hypothetical protein
VTREQRLRTAVDTSTETVKAASKDRDEQAIFEALGECLMWVVALDDLLEDRVGYESLHNSDRQRQGQFLRGLRYARNAIVHGDAVVDLADIADVPYPPGLLVHNRPGPRIFGPPTLVQWTFQQTLPAPTRPAPDLEAAYAAHVASREVSIPIVGAVDWLHRALATA